MDDMDGLRQPGNPADTDATAEVRLSADRRKAWIRLHAPQGNGKLLDEAALRQQLAAAGVCFGVKDDAVRDLAIHPRYEWDELAAEGVPPVKGRDSSFAYHFAAADHSPQFRADGSVDFKQLGIFQNVRTDDVLCTKTPAAPGADGTDVTGGVLPALPGKELRLPAGKNTKISADGLQVLAACDGAVEMRGKSILVENVYRVSADVDYQTGNIDFVGSVYIQGGVKPGFSVRAEGSVVVDGCLEGGELSAGGNATVSQGVIGVRTGSLRCGGTLRCKYLQNAFAEAGQDLEAGYIVNSTVRAGGSVRLLGRSAAILSSQVTAGRLIECINVGSHGTAAPSTLVVGSDPQVAERSAQIPMEMEKARNQLASLDRYIEIFTHQEEQGRLSETQKQDLTKLRDGRDAVHAQLDDLAAEKDEVEQRLLESGYGEIIVTGTAFAGTHLIIGTEKKKLTIDMPYARFTRGEEGIVIGSA